VSRRHDDRRTLRTPGCYAWQIDGTTFSYTVVFKAVQTR